jgi:hypothetical protein
VVRCALPVMTTGSDSRCPDSVWTVHVDRIALAVHHRKICGTPAWADQTLNVLGRSDGCSRNVPFRAGRRTVERRSAGDGRGRLSFFPRDPKLDPRHTDAGDCNVLSKLLLALGLMALSVVIHASGVTWSLEGLIRRTSLDRRFWPLTWMCIRLAALMIVCHLIEIAAWASVYSWRGAMPDLQSAFYFSAVTYTTTGYGDLVLPAAWRLVGAVEALTGILMCGWSTGFFFAVLSRVLTADSPSDDAASGLQTRPRGQ